MKIAQFQTLGLAQAKLDYYNELARNVEQGDPDLNLTDIYKHITINLWWFNFTDCVENGGMSKNMIESDIDTLDTFDAESYEDLINLGYLPQPEI